MTTPVASLGILASSVLATGHLGQCSHASMRRALVHSCRGNNRLVRSSSPPSPPRSLAQTAELNVAYSTKAGDSYCSLSPECPLPLYVGKHWLVPKSCLKDGGVPKSPCSCNWQPWCPSAGPLSNIGVCFYHWGPWPPRC